MNKVKHEYMPLISEFTIPGTITFTAEDSDSVKIKLKENKYKQSDKLTLKGSVGCCSEAVYLGLSQTNVCTMAKKMVTLSQPGFVVQPYVAAYTGREYRFYFKNGVMKMAVHTSTSRSRKEQRVQSTIYVTHIPLGYDYYSCEMDKKALELAPDLCKQVLPKLGITDDTSTYVRVDCFYDEKEEKLFVNEVECDLDTYCFSQYHSDPLIKDWSQCAFKYVHESIVN
jgi:hypothetical protein